jgi:hypothetical protein
MEGLLAIIDDCQPYPETTQFNNSFCTFGCEANLRVVKNSRLPAGSEFRVGNRANICIVGGNAEFFRIHL